MAIKILLIYFLVLANVFADHNNNGFGKILKSIHIPNEKATDLTEEGTVREKRYTQNSNFNTRYSTNRNNTWTYRNGTINNNNFIDPFRERNHTRYTNNYNDQNMIDGTKMFATNLTTNRSRTHTIEYNNRNQYANGTLQFYQNPLLNKLKNSSLGITLNNTQFRSNTTKPSNYHNTSTPYIPRPLNFRYNISSGWNATGYSHGYFPTNSTFPAQNASRYVPKASASSFPCRYFNCTPGHETSKTVTPKTDDVISKKNVTSNNCLISCDSCPTGMKRVAGICVPNDLDDEYDE